MQDMLLIQYLVFLKDTVEDVNERNEKILKAVNDYYIARRI